MRRTSLHYSLKSGNIVHVKEIKHFNQNNIHIIFCCMYILMVKSNSLNTPHVFTFHRLQIAPRFNFWVSNKLLHLPLSRPSRQWCTAQKKAPCEWVKISSKHPSSHRKQDSARAICENINVSLLTFPYHWKTDLLKEQLFFYDAKNNYYSCFHLEFQLLGFPAKNVNSV